MASSKFVLLLAFAIIAAVTLFVATSPQHVESTPNEFNVAVATRNTNTKSVQQRNDAPSVTREAASPTRVRKPIQGHKNLVNGVLLLLYGGRWSEEYLLRHNLPRLEQYFLSCFGYPVIIFHEGMSASSQAKVNSLVPSAGGGKGVTFEDVSSIWKKLPHGISESKLKQWMSTPQQKPFQGRGYRLMCRFWAGVVWSLPVLDQYDYYWRLDTDAYLTRPVTHDPFVTMTTQKCEYGFNRLKGDAPGVVVDLWKTWKEWAAEANVDKDRVDAVTKFATNGKAEYSRPMFYNNFELGTLRLKRSKLYMSFFDFVDSREPFGILRYRWGDAPLHTLGVYTELGGDKMCNFTQEMVGYRHAVKRPPPIDDARCQGS